MTTMEPVSALVHLDSPFINFRDFDFGEGSHGYRWVNAKRFQLSSEALDDRDVLAALIAHPQFRDTYDGACCSGLATARSVVASPHHP